MAKSIRSKRRRKMRSVKREKYGKKELERLKGVLDKAEKSDVEMKELYTVKTGTDLKKEKDTEDTMDTAKPKQKVNLKTLKNEHGNYPVWMNQRKVKNFKKQQKKTKERSNKGKKK